MLEKDYRCWKRITEAGKELDYRHRKRIRLQMPEKNYRCRKLGINSKGGSQLEEDQKDAGRGIYQVRVGVADLIKSRRNKAIPRKWM